MIKKIIIGLTALTFIPLNAEACTTMLVTKGASADGSVIVSHSNDGWGADINLVFVPAKDHLQGEMRPVYPTSAAVDEMPEYNAFAQPSLVAPERSSGYDYPNLPRTKPLGYIPEVSHTYAYLDSDYGIMNEHGLMFGESTCLCDRTKAIPYKDGGGIFYSTELSRVALERAKTAREAIKLMGSLIDEYGLWGTGESLIVADKNEGWIFEMTPLPNGKGGLWIAEKIPDGDFFVAANQFRIRAIKEGNSNQLFNPLLPQKLKELGWATYDENQNLDWVLSVQGKEFNHPYYSQRRIWRAFSSVASSKNFSSSVSDWNSDDYPLSIRPDKKLTAQDIMALHRDYYNGTEFDKSQSSLSGLYGSPYHYGAEKGERSILSAKTSYTHVNQASDKLPAPICWYSINSPAENPFVPLTVSPVPDCYDHALRNKYDSTKMYWTSCQVMGMTQGYYQIMSPIVSANIEQAETKSLDLLQSSLNLSPEEFAATLRENATLTQKKWQDLYVELLLKYDGGAGVSYDKEVNPNTPENYQ